MPMMTFRRSFWSLLLILFSVQILCANFALDKCHHEEAEHSTYSQVGIQSPEASQGMQDNDNHCNDFGFCLAGHCHMSHCSVFVSNSTVSVDAIHMLNILGAPHADALTSLLNLDRPWQPPRA